MFYISDNVVTMRGCSTKRPVFFVECENHMSGLIQEQICYCSFDFCNHASRADLCLYYVFIAVIFGNVASWKNELTSWGQYCMQHIMNRCQLLERCYASCGVGGGLLLQTVNCKFITAYCNLYSEISICLREFPDNSVLRDLIFIRA